MCLCGGSSRRGLVPDDPITVIFSDPLEGAPTGRDFPEQLKVGADEQHGDTIVNGISRIGYMKGGEAARWVDEDMADVLTAKAGAFIEKNSDRPFFIFRLA